MRAGLVAAALAAALPAFAGGVVGEALRVEGKVTLVRRGAPPVPLAVHARLRAGDIVRTGRDGRALLEIGRARVMLAPRSSMRVRSESRADFGFGRVFFRVLHRLRRQLGFEVHTSNAVLGVRGTEFSVEGEKKRLRVLLKEGKVEARARRGKFRRHEGPPPSFAEFVEEQRRGVEEMQREFEAYAEQTRREFAAFVRSIVLEAGQGLVLSGADAWTYELKDEDLGRFRDFESWLEETR